MPEDALREELVLHSGIIRQTEVISKLYHLTSDMILPFLTQHFAKKFNVTVDAAKWRLKNLGDELLDYYTG